MFKDVPYFCHSHLMSLMPIAATNTVPNPPKFDPTAVPPSPMHMEKILSTEDIAKAQAMVVQVGLHATQALSSDAQRFPVGSNTW
jgi:hypothetical protein